MMMRVQFLNWNEYQGEGKRYETSRWIRLEVGLVDHPLWDTLDGTEFKAFVFLMLHTGRRAHKTGILESSLETMARTSGISKGVLQSTLEKCTELGIVQVTPIQHGESTVTAPCEPREDTGRSPGHGTERNVTERNDLSRSAASVLVEGIYKAKYPRKVGKTKGVERVVRSLKTQADAELFDRAVDAFVAYHRSLRTEMQFIPHFSTFASTWRDWLPDVDSVVPVATAKFLVYENPHTLERQGVPERLAPDYEAKGWVQVKI